MADLGAIAETGGGGIIIAQRRICAVGVGDLAIGIERENTEGNPPPSQVMRQPAVWEFRTTFFPGVRTISVEVKQVSDVPPRPILRVKSNPAIGIMEDVIGVAPPGSGWKVIGPLTVNVTSAGATYVELEARYQGAIPPDPCYWDNLFST